MRVDSARSVRAGTAALAALATLSLGAPSGCSESEPSCPIPDAAGDDGGTADGETGSEAEVDGVGDEGDSEVAACGNGAIDTGEECDGSALGGATCESIGRTPGTLACGADCRYDTSGCAVCGDHRCEGGETPLTCAGECAVVDVSAGSVHTCAALADGTVRCWGARDGHRMGGVGDVTRPVVVAGIAGATQVAAGEAHTCAIHGGGMVSCWGRSGFGECRSTAASVWGPAVVTELTGATEIAAGKHHTCAIAADGQTYCWGRGDFGNLGNGTHERANAVPQPVVGAAGATVLAAGAQHTCAGGGGGVTCWGKNDVGQVGGSDREWHDLPEAPVTGGGRAFGVGSHHGCACVMMMSWPPHLHGLYCWGNNSQGQLGVAPSPDALAPAQANTNCPAVLDGGDAFTCQIQTVPGPVHCWGGNASGQLGDGTQVSRHTPAPVVGISDAVRLAAGEAHICALLQDGTLRCWGRNAEGQNGNGTTARFHLLPVEPVGL